MQYVDVTVLGGGPAGYRVALNLASRGKKTALIEKDKAGGTCLHKGCIPTKSILESSLEFQISQGGRVREFDDESAREKMEKNIGGLYRGLKHKLVDAELELLHGTGSIVERGEDGWIVDIDEKKISSDNLVVATGSSSKSLEIPGFEKAMADGVLMYAEEFFQCKNWKMDTVIIGAGAIGIELATFLAETGNSVTLLEANKALFSDVLDEELGLIAVKNMENIGIDIKSGVNIIELDGNTLVYERDGTIEELEAKRIIVAAGRKGNVQGYGLEEQGVAIKNGFIAVDENCKTNVDGIFACGDVIGMPMLAHAAYHEAEIVADCICGERHKHAQFIPQCIFTHPEIALVGRRKIDFDLAGEECKVYECSMRYSSRYYIQEKIPQRTSCRLVFDRSDVLAGAQLVGNGAAEMIFPLMCMMEDKKTLSDIRNMVYPHPSLVEVIREAIE